MNRLQHHQRAPRRFFPPPGGQLSLSNVRGPWRPSGAVAGAGMFSVVWSTHGGDFWAPLHDFEPADQLRLVEACRWLDQISGHGESRLGGRRL